MPENDSPQPPLQTQDSITDPHLRHLDKISTLMDNKFSIGGIRFGLDSLAGIVPYVGDIAGLGVTAVLLRVVAKKGASVWILLRMLWNLILDALIGIVPVLGDLLDVAHKANRRNVFLLKDYYADPTPKPPAGIAIAVVAVLFLSLVIGMVWMTKLVAIWIWQRIFG